MKTFIIADTHFNHTEEMIKWCERPEDFNELLWRGLEQLPQECILFHLGDICIGEDLSVHERLSALPYKKILVKGNHDTKSNNWYLTHGWDFVCDEFKDTYYGKNILFSHLPRVWDGVYNINIHGHFHNSDYRRKDIELFRIKNSYQKLYAPEYENYLPVDLEKIVV